MKLLTFTLDEPSFIFSVRPLYKANVIASFNVEGKIHHLTFSLFYPNYTEGPMYFEWDFSSLNKYIYEMFPLFDYREITSLIKRELSDSLREAENVITKKEKEKPAPVIILESFTFKKTDNTYDCQFQLEGYPYLFEQTLFEFSGIWELFNLEVIKKKDEPPSIFNQKPSFVFDAEIKKQVVSLLENHPTLRVRRLFIEKKEL